MTPTIKDYQIPNPNLSIDYNSKRSLLLPAHTITSNINPTNSELKNLKQILDASSDSILITDPNTNILYTNPAWEKLTGYTSKEVEGKNPHFLQSGKTPKQIYKKVWQHLKKNQSFSHDNLINKRKDGTEFPAHSTYFPVLQDNKVLYYVQILYDISKQKKKEIQRQQLLSTVSHELKTPITVLKLLLSRFSTSKKRQCMKDQEWQTINQELDRLVMIINESLDISRIESNRLNIELIPSDLNQLIKETITHISIIAKDHTINYLPIKKTLVIIDPKRIKQVLINLLTNAIKFSPRNTKIKIKVSLKKHHALISIKDQGIGIPKPEQTLIFDQSYQIQKHSSEGLGLGLYISKEIIKKHHGKIWVQSKVGIGSTFLFTLPLFQKPIIKSIQTKSAIK